MHKDILTLLVKKEEKFLRQKTAPFDFKAHTKKEIAELISRMRRIMREANGVGLSANQIGLDMQVFVAEVPSAQNEMKFYAIFNPVLEKAASETIALEEGCLSIPERYGEVERAQKVTLTGMDKNGKPVRIKAWGLLARVFQHETDHLNGKLFIDRTKKVYAADGTPAKRT